MKNIWFSSIVISFSSHPFSRNESVFAEKPGLAPTFYDLEDMTNLMFKTIGETARFRCEAKSDLPVKYSWFKNGKPLRKHRRRISYNNFQLRIKRLTLADGANYTCVANNTFGSVSYNFTLHMIRMSFVNISPLHSSFKFCDYFVIILWLY